MKIKVYTYLSMVTILLGVIACAKQSTPYVTTSDLTDITLVPFTSAEFSFSGLVSEDWVEVKPGQFQPEPEASPTLLGQVSFPGTTIEQVTEKWQLPESIGSTESANFTWDQYRAEFDWPDAGTLVVDIALTESESGVYFVVLVTLADEHELLHETVMVPAIHALTLVIVTGDRSVAILATPLAREPVSVSTKVRTTDGMIMVYVPAGEFGMGNRGIQWMWNGNLRDSDLGLQVYTDENPQYVVYDEKFKKGKI